MRGFPADYIATLVIGLRDDSRIKLKASGLKVDLQTLLLAHIVDNTAINIYAKTKDAQTGRNRPKSIVEALTHDDSEDVKGFDSGADFMEEWRRINGN